MRLEKAFYLRDDVVQISKDLLGKYLVTDLEGIRAVGRIVETEAYRGPEDKASHAYGNRLTPRTQVMFEAGGLAYVYLCYGIHHLFNVVTGAEGQPHAVLIRALEPVEALDTMLLRRDMKAMKPRLTAGPGSLSKAMGIQTAHTGTSLVDPESPIWIEDRGDHLPASDILAGPRVGVDYAGECALWEWRFRIKNSTWTSLPR
ncbi:MAG: DNA-3-methyladenine glycosylase [Saprospirales bacterium]|nr:DNA-3-methyladenine glycosylase [Saprospirales bacterium]MBK8490679.1 DNA-3-methyladenine glycosylase [Saprospirales bacterium]